MVDTICRKQPGPGPRDSSIYSSKQQHLGAPAPPSAKSMEIAALIRHRQAEGKHRKELGPSRFDRTKAQGSNSTSSSSNTNKGGEKGTDPAATLTQLETALAEARRQVVTGQAAVGVKEGKGLFSCSQAVTNAGNVRAAQQLRVGPALRSELEGALQALFCWQGYVATPLGGTAQGTHKHRQAGGMPHALHRAQHEAAS